MLERNIINRILCNLALLLLYVIYIRAKDWINNNPINMFSTLIYYFVTKELNVI